jgi:hypothetical protein
MHQKLNTNLMKILITHGVCQASEAEGVAEFFVFNGG